MTKLLLAAISAFLIASMLPSVSSAASSDPPLIIPWHQVGGIGIGLTRARVEYDYGRPHASWSFGRAYALHGGHVFVSYDRSGHVNDIDVDTPYYKAASGFGVGYRMPLGICHRNHGSCVYRWHGFTYDSSSSNWYRYFVWSGARMQVLISVDHGIVQEFSIAKLGGAGISVRPPATVFYAIVAATLHELCGNTPCDVTVKDVRLSKTDTSYAVVDSIWKAGVGGAVALLHRVRGIWKIVDYGSSAVGCGQAPIKVLNDLALDCP